MTQIEFTRSDKYVSREGQRAGNLEQSRTQNTEIMQNHYRQSFAHNGIPVILSHRFKSLFIPKKFFYFMHICC